MSADVPDAAVPVDDGKVDSTPPATTKSPDGWTLTISAKDEIQMPAAPLTTAISSREYIVGGVYNGALSGNGDSPKGVFEVGYQIGCGIDMSTSNGVYADGHRGHQPVDRLHDSTSPVRCRRASCRASAPTSAAVSPWVSSPASSTSFR